MNEYRETPDISTKRAWLTFVEVAPRDLFLDELATLNIPLIGGNQADTLGAGYRVCEDLRNGVSVLDEMDAVEQTYQLASGQGTLFVSAATTNLCPDFAAG